jgi:hypothetical protein
MEEIIILICGAAIHMQQPPDSSDALHCGNSQSFLDGRVGITKA